jgi:hypothetical protein
MDGLGAPEILIVLAILGVPAAFVVLVILAVRASGKKQPPSPF